MCVFSALKTRNMDIFLNETLIYWIKKDELRVENFISELFLQLYCLHSEYI